MLCSKPAATKAEIGNTTATNLSVTLRPAIAIHTARHTRILHSTPFQNSAANGAAHLAPASVTTSAATRPSFIAGWPDSHTSNAMPAAPAKLAAHTTSQLRSSA
ncbi:hypothetical protein D3C72_1959830 [compost metagenome]